MAPNLPKTYKAAIFRKANEPLTLEDVELKEPVEGEVLIKVLATGICHSDAAVQAGVLGSPFPMIPGHETVGEVVAVGPGEKTWKVGDRVGAPWHGGHDSTCKSCKRGLYQMCDNEAINGVTRNGGYAEYCILRTEAVVRIPTDIDPASAAPLLCAGVTVFNSIRNMHITPGETVAVLGLGGLGHLAIQYAARMGYRVVALSSSGDKEHFARKLGAHDYIDGSKVDTVEALNKLGGAAMVVATAPNAKVMGPLLGALNACGKLLILGVGGSFELDPATMLQKGLSIQAWPSGHSLDCEEAIDFAKIHDVNCMIEKFPLKDAQKGLEHMLSGKARFRAVLTME